MTNLQSKSILYESFGLFTETKKKMLEAKRMKIPTRKDDL